MPRTRIEPCESFGKYVLEIYVEDRWQALHVDHLAVLERMKELIDKMAESEGGT